MPSIKTRKLALAAALLAGLICLSADAQGKAKIKSGGETIFSSIFWIGTDENTCVAKNSLWLLSLEECEKDYPRAENEIRDTVSKRNARGANLKWGVFGKCLQFESSEEFDKEYAKFAKQCSGIKPE